MKYSKPLIVFVFVKTLKVLLLYFIIISNLKTVIFHILQYFKLILDKGRLQKIFDFCQTRGKG